MQLAILNNAVLLENIYCKQLMAQGILWKHIDALARLKHLLLASY